MTSNGEVQVASVPQAPPGRPALAYEQSSQARKWHFTKDQMNQMRSTSWQSTKEKVLRAWKLEEEAPVPETAAVRASDSAAEVSSQLPTPDEERQLVTFYLMKIPGVATAFKMPELVHATAMTFMKRFYLRNSCLDYHPKNVMCVAIVVRSTWSSTDPYSLQADLSVSGDKG
jgi:cyclin H